MSVPSKTWTFNLNPVAASRPRLSRFGAYFSGPYKEFRSAAPRVIDPILVGHTPYGGTLEVTIKLFVEQPKATKLLLPKPDVDNYAKAVLDSLNKKLWEDDSQVRTLKVTKAWAGRHSKPRFIVTVKEL